MRGKHEIFGWSAKPADMNSSSISGYKIMRSDQASCSTDLILGETSTSLIAPSMMPRNESGPGAIGA